MRAPHREDDMERLRGFIGRELDGSRLRDGPALTARKVRPRWVPDELGDFDEVELALPLDADHDLSIALAVEGIKAGASDFLTKPWTNNHLMQSVETVLSLAGTGGGGYRPSIRACRLHERFLSRLSWPGSPA